MTNISTDTNTREYWVWAVNNPKDAGLRYGEVEAMSESLTFTDPEYWKKVVADPDAYGYSQHQADALSEWATKPRSERNPQMTDDDEQFAERQFLAAFSESDNNGTSINWRYWVHQMPTLTSVEASQLMSSLDPDMSSESRLNQSDLSKLRKKAAMIQRHAEREGIVSARPGEWLAWANKHQIAVHDGFRLEVESAPAQNTGMPVLVEAAKGSSAVTRKLRVKKPSIESVALVYMRTVYQSAQFASAAKFHKHLFTTAGKEPSPFEKGTGTNANKLFCPAAGSFFDVGTLGKLWPKVRAK